MQEIEASTDALFRYQVVAMVRSNLLSGMSLKKAVHLTASMSHQRLDGRQQKVSVRSVYRWTAAYDNKSITGLEATHRTTDTVSNVLSKRFLDFLQEQKELDIEASIPELIRRANEYGIIKSYENINRTTVYRAMLKMGLPVKRCKKQRDRDSRRFAYPHRMDMVLCDGKHFRAGAKRLKRVALFFLDDSSRYGIHVVVGTSENTELFLRGLYETIGRGGYMICLYVDHGPGFISKETIQVAQKLGILLIHGEKAYPEGHGKIEKFNQTAKADVIRGLDRRPDVDPACGALELRLQHYLRKVYGPRPHESLDRQPPLQRFYTDKKQLRFPDNDEQLRGKFVMYLKKKVSKDNIVSVDSVPYEMPGGHAGSWVIVHKRLLDGKICFPQDGKLIELKQVDLALNAISKRAKRGQRKNDVSQPLPKSAADLMFENDFNPVIDTDGGFSK